MSFTHTSINSKWIKHLNIRPETLKLVQEREGNTLELIGISNDFLNRTQIAQWQRERTDKWDYMKLKSFCTTKKMKRLTTEWEKIFASCTSDKGLITRIQRKLKKTKLTKKINKAIKKWVKEMNRAFSKEEVQIAKKHLWP
jgi:hypothetical protein